MYMCAYIYIYHFSKILHCNGTFQWGSFSHVQVIEYGAYSLGPLADLVFGWGVLWCGAGPFSIYRLGPHLLNYWVTMLRLTGLKHAARVFTKSNDGSWLA